jgi:hypothetical protein
MKQRKKSEIETTDWKGVLPYAAYGAMREGLGLSGFLAEAKRQFLALGAEVCEAWREQREERTSEITASIDLNLPYEELKIHIVRAAIEVYRERFPNDPRQPLLERSYHEDDDGVIHLRDDKDTGDSYYDDIAIFLINADFDETPRRLALELHSTYHNRK